MRVLAACGALAALDRLALVVLAQELTTTRPLFAVDTASHRRNLIVLAVIGCLVLAALLIGTVLCCVRSGLWARFVTFVCCRKGRALISGKKSWTSIATSPLPVSEGTQDIGTGPSDPIETRPPSVAKAPLPPAVFISNFSDCGDLDDDDLQNESDDTTCLFVPASPSLSLMNRARFGDSDSDGDSMSAIAVQDDGSECDLDVNTLVANCESDGLSDGYWSEPFIAQEDPRNMCVIYRDESMIIEEEV